MLDVAQREVLEQVAWYAEHAGGVIANRFYAEFREAVREIVRQPRRGRPLLTAHPDLVGVRTWIMRRFPFLIFYREVDGAIQVLHVLHGARDRDRWLL